MNYKLLTLALLLVGYVAKAQNSFQPEVAKKILVAKYANATSKGTRTSVKSGHPYDWYFDQKVKEYEERMEAKAKEYKKLAKLLEKPQYSNPAYFGHKRKPKKHKPGKRKFCKECEIVH